MSERKRKATVDNWSVQNKLPYRQGERKLPLRVASRRPTSPDKGRRNTHNTLVCTNSAKKKATVDNWSVQNKLPYRQGESKKEQRDYPFALILCHSLAAKHFV